MAGESNHTLIQVRFLSGTLALRRLSPVNRAVAVLALCHWRGVISNASSQGSVICGGIPPKGW